MKKLIKNLLLVLIVAITLQQYVYSQSNEGIIYQAEARDNRGNLLKNTPLDVKITILKDHARGSVVWEELHQITSNNYGMFVLQIGSGQNLTQTTFDAIEWGKNPHFLNVKVKNTHAASWTDSGTNSFSSVPYALHAKTAEKLVDETKHNQKTAASGVPSQTWSLFGNQKTDPEKDKLGTTDATDLVLVTNNQERLRITSEGKLITPEGVGLEIGGNLTVKGDSTYIDKDLYVGRNVYLNLSDEFNPKGETINHGKFTAQDSTFINGNLEVNGETTFKNKTIFDINIAGGQKDIESYPVLIKGSNQGLAIDLTPASDGLLTSQRGNNFISFWRDGIQKGRIESTGIADLDPSGVTNLICALIANPPNIFENITNQTKNITEFNFSSLFSFNAGEAPNLTWNTPILSGGSFTNLTFPTFNQPTFYPGSLPGLTFNLEPIQIENPFVNPCTENPLDIFLNNINGLKGSPGDPAYEAWKKFEEIMLEANIFGEENTENAESQLFSNYTLDFLTTLINLEKDIKLFAISFAGPHDPEDIITAAYSLYINILTSILQGSYAALNVGVAYESGAGDYAEWLLRADANEAILPGDIVGVIGGKISKNYIHAEKFMVVSSAPIVLGNMPENKEEELNAEKVAFMGQVPVKVQGKVAIGDYIVPSGEGNGIAIAVHPKNMLAKDYKRIIGVAWEESKPGELVSMINTAVGINNNDMANVIEEMQFTLNSIQKSLKKLDPSFEVSLYEVSINKRNAPLDYSVSYSHKNNISKYLENQNYNNRDEMLLVVKRTLENEMKVDFEKAPLIKYLLENPENAKAVQKNHELIMEDMISFKNQFTSKQLLKK